MKYKKELMIFAVVTAVIILGSIIFLVINNKSDNSFNPFASGTKELTKINYDEFTRLVEAEEEFIVMIGAEGCSHCAEFKPRLEKYNYKYNLDIKYIVVNEVPEEDLEVFLNKVKMLYGNENGTPKTVYFKEGVMQTYPKIYGAKDNAYIESFLKGAGVTNGI